MARNLNLSQEEIFSLFSNIQLEAEAVRSKDRVKIKRIFSKLYQQGLDVGIGFQRAYGSILSGDFFELFRLPGENYLFVFADISGHGLPAYTTLVKLRSSIILAIHEAFQSYERDADINFELVVKDISDKFTNIMEASVSEDFASVIFTVIEKREDKFFLNFYNRGMYFPLLMRNDGGNFDFVNLNESSDFWVPHKGPLLGSEIRKILEKRYDSYPVSVLEVCGGDRVIFFSDGIVEAQGRDSGDEFGIERMENCLTLNKDLFPQAVINTLFDEVYEYMGDPKEQSDDMTAVMIDFPDFQR